MTGQSTVTGTIAAYAGGSITATFVSQGGGSPAVTTVSGNIASNGTFSLLAWDNTNALYAPSQTNFQIQVGESTFYNAITTVAGTSENISSIFSGAPTPPSEAGVSQIVAGTNISITPSGGTGAVTVNSSGGSVTFDQVGSGTNLGHGLVAGNGCVISSAGTGIINANELNGALLSGLATGILRNTTSTGVPTSSELSGDVTTSGSNVATVVKVNGGALPVSAAALATNSSGQIVAGSGGAAAVVNITGAVTITATGGTGSVSNGKYTVATACSALTLSVIPGTYNHLKLIASCQSSQGGYDTMAMRLNGDSGAHYDWGFFFGGGTVDGTSGTNNATSAHLFLLTGSSDGQFTPSETLFADYADATKISKNPSGVWQRSDRQNGGSPITGTFGFSWIQTAAITSITYFPLSGANFVAGSTFTLYGLL